MMDVVQKTIQQGLNAIAYHQKAMADKNEKNMDLALESIKVSLTQLVFFSVNTLEVDHLFFSFIKKLYDYFLICLRADFVKLLIPILRFMKNYAQSHDVKTLNTQSFLYNFLFQIYVRGACHKRRVFLLAQAYLDQSTEYYCGQQKLSACAWRSYHAGEKIPLAYFIHRADHLPDFAVGQILLNLIDGHLKQENSEFNIIVYFSWDKTSGTSHFIEVLQKRGVPIRDFTAITNTEKRFVQIRKSMDIDKIGVAVALMNSAIEMMLFSSRCAPLQCYFNMGATHEWLYDKTDYLLHSGSNVESYTQKYGIDKEKTLAFQCPLNNAVHEDDAKKITRETLMVRRATDAVAIGCHGRLEKIDIVYLRVIEKILNYFPNVTFLVGGTGDVALIVNWSINAAVANRVMIANQFVAYQEFLPHIQIFTNTFPARGGLATLEAMSFGIPVVSMQMIEDEGTLKSWRDPNLFAKNEDEYFICVKRLIEDKAFYYASGLKCADIILNQQSLVSQLACNEKILMEAFHEKNSS